MHVVTGPARYYYLRKVRGHEEFDNWPPPIKPLEGPAHVVCTAVRLYADASGWRAEYADGSRPATAPNDSSATTDGPAFMLNRSTVLGLLHEGKRGRAEVGLVGVRVVNVANKGIDFATHLIVHALSGSGLGSTRQLVVAPIDAMVLGEYIEHGDRAEAELDLRIDPAQYAVLPRFMSDDAILVGARQALDASVENTARFYTYGPYARHGISLEAEAGRVSMYGRADLKATGEIVTQALLAAPGVVEVSDHLLYVEDLQEKVQTALAAKGLGDVQVLSEHALIMLGGEVASTKERYQAEEIAKRIPGVRGVVNSLVVSAPVS